MPDLIEHIHRTTARQLLCISGQEMTLWAENLFFFCFCFNEETSIFHTLTEEDSRQNAHKT